MHSSREPSRGLGVVELLSSFPDPGSTTKAEHEKQYLRAEDEGMHIPAMGGMRSRRHVAEGEAEDSAKTTENFLQKYIKYGNPVTRKEKGGTNDLISMAIRDMQTQHNKRITKVLNKEMEDAAQDYADNIKKEVNMQSSYVRSRDKARALEKKVVKAREHKIRKENNSWLDLF
eukprot:3698052-Rhodomonas_salina.2